MFSKLKKYIKFIPIVLILIIILCFFQTNYETNRKLLSFEDAYLKAERIALEWNPNSLLYSAGSVDLDNNKNYKYDKRAGWNFHFSFNNSNEHCIIEIKNGQVYCVNYIESDYVSEDKLINREEIKITFRKVLKQAIKDFSLKPGKNWAIGYHYQIYKDNAVPMIAVIGVNSMKMQQRIYYNSNTGKYIKEMHKEPVGGGLYINSKKVELFDDYKWGAIGVNSINNGYLVWGYKVTDYILSTPFLIKRTGDENCNIKINDMVVYSWINEEIDNNKIFVLTANNLMYSSDNGLNWINIFSIDFSLIDYFIEDKNSIYLLTASNLYHIQDEGKRIETIPTLKNISRIVKDKEDILHALIDGNLYYLDNNEWRKEGNYSELYSLEILDNYLIIGSDKEINILYNDLIIYSLNNENFKSYTIYPEDKNCFKVVINNKDIHKFSYKGGGKWEISKYSNDEFISNIYKINDINYLCTVPQFIWTSNK